MNSKLRRYEVLLPVQFNDGREIPEEWLGEAFNQIVERFGGASFQSHAMEGGWRNEGVLYRDELARIIVDVPDTAKSRRWMKSFKKTWKQRLDQLEIWMVSYKVDIE